MRKVSKGTVTECTPSSGFKVRVREDSILTLLGSDPFGAPVKEGFLIHTTTQVGRTCVLDLSVGASESTFTW